MPLNFASVSSSDCCLFLFPPLPCLALAPSPACVPAPGAGLDRVPLAEVNGAERAVSPEGAWQRGAGPVALYELPPQDPGSQHICQAWILFLSYFPCSLLACGACRLPGGSACAAARLRRLNWLLARQMGPDLGRSKPLCRSPSPVAGQPVGPGSSALVLPPSPSPRRTGKCVVRCKCSRIRAAGAKGSLHLLGADGVVNPHCCLPPRLPSPAPLCLPGEARRVPVQAEAGSHVSGWRLAFLLELFKTSKRLPFEGCCHLPRVSGARGCPGGAIRGSPGRADGCWKQLGQGRDLYSKTWEREGEGDPKHPAAVSNMTVPGRGPEEAPGRLLGAANLNSSLE